jgi:hypothetical protein
MIKLQDVEDKAYIATRAAQVRAMETERLGKIHVSDIIKPCMRYVTYSKITQPVGMTFDDMKSLWFGQIVHSTTILGKKEHNEIFVAYDWVRDEPVSLEEAKKIPDDDPRHLDIIYGSIDDILPIGDKWMICDKKTTKQKSLDYLKRQTSRPNDGHMDQINRYRVLLKKCYDIDAEFGCVVYIPNSITEETHRIVPKAFKLKPIEETLTDMIEKSKIIKKSLKEKLLPPRTITWLCDYCPYASKCATDEREKYED